MNRIKKFFEMFKDKYDYDKIIRMIKKSHGWGFGVINKIDDFEDNEEYFKDPIDENDYVEQFHIYLTDLECNRLKGGFINDRNLRVGHWNKGVEVNNPRSIWSQRM
jgi:hypothetical protein